MLRAYREEVDRLGRAIKAELPKAADADKRLAALNHFLFQERGFHGSRLDYYARGNSYLNEVLDDREGLPITLAVIYIDLARQLDLPVVGVALPGHFVVRYRARKRARADSSMSMNGGKEMSAHDAADKVLKTTGQELDKKDLAPVAKKAIVLRMLHNLLNVAQHEQDRPGLLRYLDAIVTLSPDAHAERWARAVFRYQAGQPRRRAHDCDYLLAHAPADVDLDRVRELRSLLMRNP